MHLSVWIDIQMPVLNGIAFLQTIKNSPQVIITTAYTEYAPQEFDLNVCDNLLKLLLLKDS